MNIIVCMKQVPKTEFELEIADSKMNLKEENLIFDVNEFDDYALEAALQLKEQHGGELVAVTMGPDRAREVLHLALAKGADRAVHINDPLLVEADVNATAEVLARVIKGLKFDLILTGVEATDDASAQTGVLLAEKLSLPHATVVTKVTVED
ncbi:MAG: electron transfer flavoprotein subunit beta/FixA family protein, partial [Candidatus Bathyarchaeia archaeon]